MSHFTFETPSSILFQVISNGNKPLKVTKSDNNWLDNCPVGSQKNRPCCQMMLSMYKAIYNNFEIEIIDEHDYTVNSTDNRIQYDIVHRHPEDDMCALTSIYGIKIYKDGLYKTAIVMAAGGRTCMGPDSAIIDDQSLLLTCCNKVFNLQLPNLQLNWLVVADMATCFSIYQYEDSYIVHGELEITRVDRSGKIIWQIGGRDIFVNIDHIGSTFQMHDEYIELMDWQGFRYKLFYNGTMIDDGTAPLAPKHE